MTDCDLQDLDGIQERPQKKSRKGQYGDPIGLRAAGRRPLRRSAVASYSTHIAFGQPRHGIPALVAASAQPRIALHSAQAGSGSETTWHAVSTPDAAGLH